jgi:hypothetical protein
MRNPSRVTVTNGGKLKAKKTLRHRRFALFYRKIDSGEKKLHAGH